MAPINAISLEDEPTDSIEYDTLALLNAFSMAEHLDSAMDEIFKENPVPTELVTSMAYFHRKLKDLIAQHAPTVEISRADICDADERNRKYAAAAETV